VPHLSPRWRAATPTAVAVPNTGQGVADDRWLTPEEMAVWLPLLQLADLLPQALDRFLREHTGIGHSYLQVLALLSGAPDRRLRMSELAAKTATSKSRASHAVACLEERGWVSRCCDTTDGRARIARLTQAGRRFLDQTAPYHATAARRLALDRLEPDEVEHLRLLTAKLLDDMPTDLPPRAVSGFPHAARAHDPTRGRRRRVTENHEP
jgi:DNA-binding MarR family transcriptional regulator